MIATYWRKIKPKIPEKCRDGRPALAEAVDLLAGGGGGPRYGAQRRVVLPPLSYPL